MGHKDIEKSSFRDPSGFLFHNGETQSSVLRGFTITKSKAESGGGIYCENASPTISKCVIIDNQTSNGGGIYCENSNITITDVTINGNKYAISLHNNGCRCIKVPEIGTFIEQNPNKSTTYAKRAKAGDFITWLIRETSWGLIVNDEVIKQ